MAIKKATIKVVTDGNPEQQARCDWYLLGEFKPNKYQGTERARYLVEQNKILQEWDSRHEYS